MTFFPNLRFNDKNGNDFPDWNFKNGNEIFDNISNKKHNSDLPILAITQDYGAIPRDLIDFKITVTDKSVESYKVVEVGDFIISLRSFQGGIEYSKYKGICSPAYIILRPSISIDRIFFKYYLKTPKYITHLNRKLEGIRDGKMISYSYFSDIILPLPSIEEQNKVSTFLSFIEDRIETQKKIIEKLETLMKASREKIFSQKLRFKDEYGSDFPKWKTITLGEVGNIITGKTPSTKDENLWNGEIQFVTPTDIKDNKYQYFTERSLKSSDKLNILPEKSIMFTCIASIGKMSLSSKPCVTNQQINSLIPNSNYDNEFIFYAIANISDYIKSTQSSSTMPIINKTEFSKFKIFGPTLKEQTKIANFLSSIQEKIETEKQILEKLELQKKFLLANLFV